MKLTYNWVKEFVSLRRSPEQIAEALTMAGLEVESLAPLPSGQVGAEDFLMEVAVTPNRGDCLGILGLAREAAALMGGRLKFPPAAPHSLDGGVKRLVAVKIVNPRLCPRYSARIVQDIGVASSPSWMRDRLEACGIRSINNVVDITNYVMLETGQPLHAFDLNRLAARQIVVRPAGEIRKLARSWAAFGCGACFRIIPMLAEFHALPLFGSAYATGAPAAFRVTAALPALWVAPMISPDAMACVAVNDEP